MTKRIAIVVIMIVLIVGVFIWYEINAIVPDFGIRISDRLELVKTSSHNCFIARSAAGVGEGGYEYVVVPANIYMVGMANEYIAGKRAYLDNGRTIHVYFVVRFDPVEVWDDLDHKQFKEVIKSLGAGGPPPLVGLKEFLDYNDERVLGSDSRPAYDPF